MDNVGYSRLNATNNLISRYVAPESVVVEIGSNDASFRPYHADCDWKTVDKFGSPDIRADLDGADASLPFGTCTVDLVICTEVLEHLRIGSPLVKEFSRILKPSGAAVISVPNISSLKSRVKVLLGGRPNLAASGDCGPPLGGTGIWVDGNWVAGHVVDFNLSLLARYLSRGELQITEVERIPVELPVKVRGRKIALPTWMIPATFGDFLLVAARSTAHN